METQKIKLTFVAPDGNIRVIEVLPHGTVMIVASDNGIGGIIAECGGAMSCGTCHVYLDSASFSRLEPPNKAEVDMLDLVTASRRPTSRLSCQIKVNTHLSGALITIPEQ